MESNRMTILGARGSVPVSGAEFARYGGATACVLLEAAADQAVATKSAGCIDTDARLW